MQFKESVVDGLYVNFIDMTLPHHAGAETLVFHHGVGANNELWSQWLTVLAPHYKIARFDMRGFGRSAAAVKQDGESLKFASKKLQADTDIIKAAKSQINN